MALPPLATVEQVGHLLRVDLEADDPAIRFLLDWASELVREHTGQDISAVTGDVVRVTPRRGLIRLPQRPVTAVTALEVLDDPPGTWTVLDPAEWRWSAEDAQVYSPGYGYGYGSGYWNPPRWVSTPPLSMRVTYDHGLDEPPATVAGAVASIAAKLYNMPPGIVSERNGQRGSNFKADQFLSPMELASLSRFRDARLQ
jgi:uncharacterized phiE125 gp8 family phage protein